MIQIGAVVVARAISGPVLRGSPTCGYACDRSTCTFLVYVRLNDGCCLLIGPILQSMGAGTGGKVAKLGSQRAMRIRLCPRESFSLDPLCC